MKKATAFTCLFLDIDQPLFVQIAEGLGMRAIRHTDCQSTRAQLASFGLEHDEGIRYGTR